MGRNVPLFNYSKVQNQFLSHCEGDKKNYEINELHEKIRKLEEQIEEYEHIKEQKSKNMVEEASILLIAGSIILYSLE